MRDAGLTLVEVVVSMAIGALLLALVTSFTVRELRTIDYADKRGTAQNQIATTQDFIAQKTRTMVAYVGSTPLDDPSGKDINGPVAATTETVGFYSFVTSVDVSGTSVAPVEEVWLWVQTSGTKRQLCSQTRARTRSATDSGKLAALSPDLNVATNRTCRVLIADLAVVDSTRPVFQYVTAAFDPLSGVPSGNQVVSAPATDSSAMRALYVNLRVNAGTGVHPVVLEKTSLIQLLNKIGRNP
ncbi:prepilin-type N-terminal cleavage/methylation domain-containing protein [Kineococcus sp. NBC_00420]|uniref:prepilin-type N-terminal cleavage/methylation domain-containing protein n=1 Tax=Kineococcus sp. NBC_00420 TaxID=2903564 RepID=UPI002E1BD533